jgi:hypothetical protein
MQYTILIYEPEAEFRARTDERRVKPENVEPAPRCTISA